MFKPNALYFTDGYKIGHKKMLAPGTTRLYGTEIARSLKYFPQAKKVVSFGQQFAIRWLHDLFEESFFKATKEDALLFAQDMSLYLGMEFDETHFIELHNLQYCSLEEGIETNPNIPHLVFINTVDGFAWLTLYLETILSSIRWKCAVASTIALCYKRNATKYVNETDHSNSWLIDYLCHDFSARGLNPHDQISVGLSHTTSFKGSDTIITIPAARYYYNEPLNEVCINSVNASEHSVSTTKIFTVGEQQMIADWLGLFPKGILSIVSDTFDLWKLITEYLPANKEAIMNRDGKLVIRPDSGAPVDIICGDNFNACGDYMTWNKEEIPSQKGVIELLWEIFGGTINEQGYKVLDPHIGAIYGDSITLDRQVQIYERLKAKGFAVTNIVLGVGSYTYQYNTRDTIGMAIKGAWFEVKEEFFASPESLEPGIRIVPYNIFKDPVTDDGTKKSLKGFQFVYKDEKENIQVESEVTEEKAFSPENMLKCIYKDGKFYNQTTLSKIRENINKLI
jgi:nicotinamide phosphoribosyltransferase